MLARLTPDFPDVSPSKLRFLEEQHLVSPARTESGYRKFSPSDLERLRLILTLQRDQYLPLKVIRKYLSELDSGMNPPMPGASIGTSTGPVSTILGRERRLLRDELLRESGATPALLQEAVSAALVAPGDVFGVEALTVLKALVELQRSGIEPRHLRGYRAAAERELGLIEGALSGVSRRNEPSSRARAADQAREIAGQLDVVRSSVLRSSLSRFTSS